VTLSVSNRTAFPFEKFQIRYATLVLFWRDKQFRLFAISGVQPNSNSQQVVAQNGIANCDAEYGIAFLQVASLQAHAEHPSQLHDAFY
jgi:hypothetical protein